MAAVKLKTNFRIENRISAFYTGGKVHLSKDGNHIFCVHGANINVIDITSGKVVHSIKAEGCDEVTCFAVTPNDEFLVVAHRNLLLKQWDWKEERCVRTWKAIHIGPVVSMTFDPTSTLLATGSSDGTIILWDIVRQYCTHNLKGSQGVVGLVEFHPDSEKLLLFSAADDCKVRVWDLKTSRCKAILESHYSGVTSFAFTEDGQTMYSAGRDNIVTVWDLESYTIRKTVPVYEPLESVIVPPSDVDCSYISITSKNAYFVTAGSQGVLKVWDASTAKCVFSQQQQLLSLTWPECQADVKAQAKPKGQQEQQLETPINQAILCSALGVIAVVTYDHNILLFGLKKFVLEKQFVGYNEEILDLCFMGEKDTHFAVASNSEQIRVFEISSLSCQILLGHTDIVLALQVFKHGLMLVSGSKDNTVRVWSMDPMSGSVHCVAVGKGHTHSVGTVASARLSGSFFVSGSEDCTIKVWTIPPNLSTEKTAAPAALHVRFTERAHEKDINSVAISPNDKLLASGSQDRTARLWHLEKETSLGSFRGHRRGIWCVQFSPTDQALATSSADGTIRIWALSDFSCVKTFEGHDASVLKVTFLSRGMQLVSCGSDGLLKLWTIKSNECVKTFDEHTQKVWALAANRGQDLLISGGADSNILVWKDITETEQEEEIEKEEDQILKEQELSNLLHEKKYLKAIGLAISLNQPFRVLTIIKGLLDVPDGKLKLEKTMKKMRPDQIESVLGFCKHWNTNSKHCHVAQTVISIVLRHMTPDDLMAFSTMQQMLEGLIPYTERHIERMNRLLQQAMFVEFTWERMRRATLPAEPGFVADNSAKLAKDGASFFIDATPAVLSPSVPGDNDPGQSSIGKSGISTGHVSDDSDAAAHGVEDDINDDKGINAENLKLVATEEEKLDCSPVERTEAFETLKVPKTPKEKYSKQRKTQTNGEMETVMLPKQPTLKLICNKQKKTVKTPTADLMGSDGTTDEGPSNHEEEVEISGRTRSSDKRTATTKTPKKMPGTAKKRLGKTPSSVKSAKKAKVAGLSMCLRSEDEVVQAVNFPR